MEYKPPVRMTKSYAQCPRKLIERDSTLDSTDQIMDKDLKENM